MNDILLLFLLFCCCRPSSQTQTVEEKMELRPAETTKRQSSFVHENNCHEKSYSFSGMIIRFRCMHTCTHRTDASIYRDSPIFAQNFIPLNSTNPINHFYYVPRMWHTIKKSEKILFDFNFPHIIISYSSSSVAVVIYSFR